MHHLDDYIQFIWSAGTYSINEFSSNFKVKTKLERPLNQRLKAYHMRKLCIHRQQQVFHSFSQFFVTSLDISPLPKYLSRHCKQINRVKIKVDGPKSSLLPCIQVAGYKKYFTRMHLVFLEPYTCHWILNSLMKITI